MMGRSIFRTVAVGLITLGLAGCEQKVPTDRAAPSAAPQRPAAPPAPPSAPRTNFGADARGSFRSAEPVGAAAEVTRPAAASGLATEPAPAVPSTGPRTENGLTAEQWRDGLRSGSLSPFEAFSALARLAPESQVALPELMAALQSPQPLVRQGAVEALGRLGRRAKAALPQIEELYHGKSLATRYSAAVALALIDPERTGQVLPTIREALSGGTVAGGDEDLWNWRESPGDRQVADDLQQIVASRRDVLGQLAAWLGDERFGHRQAVILALGSGGPDAVPIVRQMLKDPKLEVRRTALEIAALLGADAEPLVPSIVDYLAVEERSAGDPESLQALTLRVLESAGPAAASATPRLIDLLARGSDEPIRALTICALGRIGRPAIPQVVALLDKPNYAVQAAAAEVLAEMGPVARDTLPRLAKVQVPPTGSRATVDLPVLRLRRALLDAMRLVSVSPEDLPRLTASRAGERDERGYPLQPPPLPLPEEAVPLLVDALQDYLDDDWAAKLLAEHPEKLKPHLPRLIEQLRAAQDQGHIQAHLDALEAMGADALPASEAISALLKQDEYVQVAAVALARIQGAAAIPLLRGMLRLPTELPDIGDDELPPLDELKAGAKPSPERTQAALIAMGHLRPRRRVARLRPRKCRRHRPPASARSQSSS